MPEPKAFYTVADLADWPELAPPGKLAIFGDPVAHSLSPQLHNPALQACGIDAQYVRIQVATHEFAAALDAVRNLGFHGVNCTIPHKLAALEACDHTDALAARLGAVNTIVFDENQTFGSNSDGPGFLRAVREAFGIDLGDLRVLILGAGGGAGRAVAIQCALEGPERLVLVNRTREKAESLRAEIAPYLHDEHIHAAAQRLQVADWSTEALAPLLGDIDLIINATSVGMKRGDPALLPGHLLQPHHMVYDMIYSPARTRLLADAESAGARAANGLSMLLHQGAISFETWFNREAPLDTMRQGLCEAADLSIG